jgi:hypothetical protein
MRERCFRLLVSGKIVGYEWHELAPCGYIRSVFSLNEDKSNSVSRVPHDDKEDFTGEYDRNGARIWEGDIVQPYDNSTHLPIYANCYIEYGKYSFSMNCVKGTHTGCWYFEVERRGTIHD